MQWDDYYGLNNEQIDLIESLYKKKMQNRSDTIFKYLKALISYHKETRVETYPFARDAVREATLQISKF